MGMWDFLNATTETVKGASQSCYNFLNAVVVNRLNHHLTNDEDRAKIGRVARNAAFYGFQEGIKGVPGGTPIFNILWRSLKDENKKKTEDDKQAIQAMKARITKPEKEFGGRRGK